MNRGDLVTVALSGDYGKPRPALVIQSTLFNSHLSVTVLPITSELRDTPLFRFTLEPCEANGLNKPSQIMVDKIQTIASSKLSTPFGKITLTELRALDRLLAVFLGLA